MDVAVVGLGLIGGSLLRTLASAGHRVYGYDADPATRATARTAAAQAPASGRWQVVGTVRDAVSRAELVVIAVPLPALGGVLAELVATGYSGLVTDVTSVKGPVQALVDQHLTRARDSRTGDSRAGYSRVGYSRAGDSAAGDGLASFVGGHPMAGRETSGFGAADPKLFTGCAWVLCLEPEVTVLADWLELAALLTTLEVRVVPATAAEHDRAVAAVSHVPHLLATALAAVVGDDPLAGTLAAGSFRDGTRVAATRPDLIAAMCGGNAAAVGSALDAVLDALRESRAAIDSADPIAALREWVGPGSAARAAWPPRAGTPLELPARADALLGLGRAGGWVTGVAADRRTVLAVRPAPRDPAGAPRDPAGASCDPAGSPADR